MAETGGNGSGAEPGAGAGGETQESAGPPLIIRAHYLKDLSFENPRAPQILAEMTSPPEVQVTVNVDAKHLSGNDFEVELTITGEAKSGNATAFVIELTYGGLFSLVNLPAEHHAPMLLIECPRLLFPFARRVIADATGEGGFLPLNVQPVDFVALYQKHVAEQQQQQAPAG